MTAKTKSKLDNEAKPDLELRARIKQKPQPQGKEVRAKIKQRQTKTTHPAEEIDYSRANKPPAAKNKRPIIQVKNLVKNYGEFKAVQEISFEVKKGEIFGILGPNGAGKTTTLEIIETLTPKTSGQVLIDGLDIEIYPQQVKKIIGIQLQSGGFISSLTLVEHLELFAALYDVRVDPMAILDGVNLKDKSGSKVDQLSGGQKQRFSIASTLVADPLVVFLDEPTTGLDPQARRNLWDMILELKQKGKTIVLTTHYMDEAEVLCDRIAIMDGGRILEINTAEGFIQELLARGFQRPQPKLGATLEDVFLDLTGKTLRE
jgi:ABC-2 type transport system ATP-binding protein